MSMEPTTAPASPDDQGWLIARLRRHLSELLRLAAPIVVARLGVLMINQVDAVMVGYYATSDLAYLNIGNAVNTNLVVTGLGLLMGTLVMTSNHFGAGDLWACGAAWRRSLPYALMLGLIAVAVAVQGEGLLALLGQDPAMAAGGGAVIRILGFGVPGMLVFLTSNFFLEGLRRPLPGMVLMLLANLLNVGLNWLLIYGHGPFSAMGAEGAAWATTAVRCFLACAILAYIWWLPDRDSFGIRRNVPRDPAEGRMQRRLGYATGLAVGAESGSFAAMAMFSGWIGENAAAAYGITFNVLAMFFMVAVGVGAATSVRVGIAYGRHDRADLTLAGWTGLGLNVTLSAAFAAFTLMHTAFLVSIYTDDPAMAPLAVALLAIAALAMIFDGGQAVMALGLRGRRDVWVPMGLQIFSYLGVMLPLGWTFSFAMGWGAAGLLWAVLVASVVSFSLLTARFHLLSRRQLERPAERESAAD